MRILRVSDVFVPGGLPKYTYVPRTERGLEAHIASAKENLCKIATVTGPTKSGKTVLVRTVLRNDSMIWVDGGMIKSVDDFIDVVADGLDVECEKETLTNAGTSGEVTGELEGEASLIVAKAKGTVSAKAGTQRESGQRTSVARSKKAGVLRALRETRRVLVIDDFHYIPRQQQGDITRLLKPLVFDGVPVIYLAIPHRRYDAVKVEREMNGRIEPITVPSWEHRELTQIAELGFPLLNIVPHAETSSSMAFEAHGSPHLMQDFCRKICYRSQVTETQPKHPRYINPKFDYRNIYHDVAADLGKNIFEKLAKGPRSRSDRLQRKLKSGKTADIYRVVLLALANLKPGVESIEYEKLRAAMRDLLDENLPQAHEVSRVLEHMARIASQDESSVSVIDFEKDERRLHITDPFFAFFLRWGHNLIESSWLSGDKVGGSNSPSAQ